MSQHADVLDAADEVSRVMLEAYLSVRKPEGPAYDGECKHCGEELTAPRRWCDADCRDHWERDNAKRLSA